MNRLSFNLELLTQAKEALTLEGFTVQAAPFELLLRGCVLTAWHEDKNEGYLIEPAELGMIARLGLAYLDPYRDDDSTLPRWQRDSTPDALRMRRYAEAVMARACAEVEGAPEGVRNQTLNRAAFVLGRYLGWGLDEAQVIADLEQAGLNAGLPAREVTSTVNRGVAKGSEEPRDPRELVFNEQPRSANKNPWASDKADLPNKPTAPTTWASSSPWGS